MSPFGERYEGGERRRIQPMVRWALLLLVTALAGCRSAPPPMPRYIVTVVPFPLTSPGPSTGICVAVDPTDPKGVWWWQPGRSGCASRSTGPSVFPGDAAKVARASSDAFDVSFEIQMQTGKPRQFRLEVREDSMRELPSGRSVSAVRRATLDVPESPPPVAQRHR